MGSKGPSFITINLYLPLRFYKTTLYRGVSYLCLADACHGMKVACAADIKVGTIDIYSLDSEKKKEVHRKKDLGIAPTLGFRFAGAKVYKPATKTTTTYDKKWGLSFTIKDAAKMTESYFDNGETIRKDVLPNIISQLRSLREYYTSQTSFWLCRSSLLMVYDGDMIGVSLIKMIDFSHYVPQVSCCRILVPYWLISSHMI
eukprot:sb/3470672/